MGLSINRQQNGESYEEENLLMFEVRIHGRGGQGVVTAAEMLSVAAFVKGRYAQALASVWRNARAARRHCPVVALMAWHGDLTTTAGRPTIVGLPSLLHSTPDAAIQQLLDATMRHALIGHEGLTAPVTTRLVQGSAADCLVAAL